jgi:hypothetical protein
MGARKCYALLQQLSSLAEPILCYMPRICTICMHSMQFRLGGRTVDAGPSGCAAAAAVLLGQDRDQALDCFCLAGIR